MSDWQQALTAQVARNIEHYRTLLGMKRSELAARCTALGLPTKRPALTALLDGRRQTVTLQELTVLAEALDTTVAQLIVPLHSGETTITGPERTAHAIEAAERLFGISNDLAGATPYRPYVRYRRAADRFARANRRLAELSHAIATGAADAGTADGRPHPASEILAAEAALSRLSAARRELVNRALVPPLLGKGWSFLDDEVTPIELPVLENLQDAAQQHVPLFVYALQGEELPVPRLVVIT